MILSKLAVLPSYLFPIFKSYVYTRDKLNCSSECKFLNSSHFTLRLCLNHEQTLLWVFRSNLTDKCFKSTTLAANLWKRKFILLDQCHLISIVLDKLTILIFRWYFGFGTFLLTLTQHCPSVCWSLLGLWIF